MNILTNSFSDLAVHRTINRSLRYFQIGSSHASIIYHILYHINYFGNDLYVTFYQQVPQSGNLSVLFLFSSQKTIFCPLAENV